MAYRGRPGGPCQTQLIYCIIVAVALYRTRCSDARMEHNHNNASRICQGSPSMLIDCELMGTERRFELPVPDVERAWSFYRDIMGAEEMFRSESGVGEPTRIGFTIGKAGFVITSQDASEPNGSRPTLALLATEFGAPFAAVVLYVPNPAGAAQRALEAGSQCRPEAACGTASYCGHPVELIIDPFGHSWAFASSPEGHFR
jgi:uncharacterized glyoxalase superfamily protein PhnB